MKKVILWFFLCCKRYLKRIPFLLLLAALPLTALAASRMENGKDGTVRIAVCCLDPEPASLGNRLKENLLARDTGLFSFIHAKMNSRYGTMWPPERQSADI